MMLETNAFAAIEQAQKALARYKSGTADIPKEGHRALAVVATKLDEARLWLDEAVRLVEDAQVAEAINRRGS
jgi:hypothetical protein